MPDEPNGKTGYEKFFGKNYKTQVNEGCLIAVVIFFLMVFVVIGTYGCMYTIASG